MQAIFFLNKLENITHIYNQSLIFLSPRPWISKLCTPWIWFLTLKEIVILRFPLDHPIKHKKTFLISIKSLISVLLSDAFFHLLP